jgi:hypothetical protein
MAVISLTKGFEAVVDDADLAFLSQWKWHAFSAPTGHVYAARNSEPVNGRRTHVFMHRVLANTPADRVTDHANGNTLDNRRANLRIATRSQNMWNRRPNRDGRSKYKGVSWHRQHQKWAAAIQIEKRRHHLGLFVNEHEAGEAYRVAAVRLQAEFYRGNQS